MPSRQPITKAANRPVLYLRRRRRARRPGIGQDARVGALDILLLAQFLEAVQEALVERAVGLGLALELLLLGFVLAGGAGNDGRALSTSSLSSSSSDFAASSSARTASVMRCVSLRKRPRTDASSLRACIDLGMVVAVDCRGSSAILRVRSTSWMRSAARPVLPATSEMLASLAGIEARLAERDQAAFLLDARRAWR